MSEVISSIILGIVQGATEFLPVSSSGHLAAIENSPFIHSLLEGLFNEVNQLQFNLILHAGTLLAIVLYYKQEIWNLIINTITILSGKHAQVSYESKQLILAIILATIPALSVPLYKDVVEQATETMLAISIAFIVNGLFLITAEYVKKRKTIKQADLISISIKAALLIGVFQCIAVFPGISRSGSTISMALLLGISPSQAVKFSFLISLPVLSGALLLESKNVLTNTSISTEALIFPIIGSIAAFIVGLLSLKALTWIGRKASFTPFGIYTIVLGTLLIITGVN
jgi:undecaprenyl-diphosphatase